MYSTNFEKIAVDEFAELIKSIDLLPSKKILLRDIDTIVPKLKSDGMTNLAQLKKLLKKKKDYPEIAKKYSTDEEYLTILNRDINGYEVKAIGIDKLEVFSEDEIKKLKELNIKTTKNLYENLLTKSQRSDISKKTGISEDTLIEALRVTDLMRINGVGLTFVKLFQGVGVDSVEDYKKFGAEEILKIFNEVNEQKKLTKVKLGIKDMEYCERFCNYLDTDIEW